MRSSWLVRERNSLLARLAAIASSRATSATGQTGLTGLRTQAGFAYKVSDKLSLSLAYLRQQDIYRNRPDVVGHAPIVGIEFSF